MEHFHIHIIGRVQGVGFRPFIYRMATNAGLSGWVINAMDGVHIVLKASQEQVKAFVENIRTNKPEQSIITAITTNRYEGTVEEGFFIGDSDPSAIPDVLISPDFAMCDKCRTEIDDPGNRRYGYPFITCTKCGPRYSILTDIPYDRNNTTMQDFQMCPECGKEYENTNDRRFYSQTNSCPACKISLELFNNQKERISGEDHELIDIVAREISTGKIIAVKGIGGYLLMADAGDPKVVTKLRERKRRPAKPFALMYPTLEMAKEDLYIGANEATALSSIESSVVLCEMRPECGVAGNEIAPGLVRLGIMLPYTPLFFLILKQIGKPVIATSGNVSDAAIIYRDQEALTDLSSISDYILCNNRKIVVPQDDSVLKYTKNGQKILIRRSRGLAPAFIQQSIDTTCHKTMLAMGAMLKSAFGIWHAGRCNISQYLGDALSPESQASYDHTLNHTLKLLQCKPETVIVDKHPAYYSTIRGKDLAKKYRSELLAVQHHEAHFYAVMGENTLLNQPEPVLGVIMDGTGYGDDGKIWGGEFFVYQDNSVSRIHYMQYFPHITGDKMSREPRISALAILNNIPGKDDLVRELFSEEEWQIYKKLLADPELSTSSTGRLFDAVACLLGLGSVCSYEGEAAMYLERLAKDYCKKNPYPESYSVSISEIEIPVSGLMESLIEELECGKEKNYIAARFHSTIVRIIEQIARQQNIKKLAFSGGVFQNGLLVDMIIEKLGKRHALYFHKDLSPNDECIPYGQLVAACCIHKKNSFN